MLLQKHVLHRPGAEGLRLPHTRIRGRALGRRLALHLHPSVFLHQILLLMHQLIHLVLKFLHLAGEAVLLELPLGPLLLVLEHLLRARLLGLLGLRLLLPEPRPVGLLLAVELPVIVLLAPVALGLHLLQVLGQPLLRLLQVQQPLLEAALLGGLAPLLNLQPVLRRLKLGLESARLSLPLRGLDLLLLHDLPHLRVVLALDHSDQRLLGVLLLVLVQGASLLQLLQGHFELLLRLYQVFFVSVLLLLKEYSPSLPQSLVPIVQALHLQQLPLQLLHLLFQLLYVLSVRRVPVVECGPRRRVERLQLFLQRAYLLGVRRHHLLLLLVEPVHLGSKMRHLLFELGVGAGERLLDLLQGLALLLVLVLPQLLF